MKRSNLLTIMLLLTTGSFFFSCQKDPPEKLTGDLSVAVQFVFGDENIVLDDIMYEAPSGNPMSIQRFKCFFSSFGLTGAGLTPYQNSNIQYLDISDASTLSFQLEELPNGKYSSISLVLGLTDEDNESGRFVDPPESQMEWPAPMGGGYHYMKFEGKYLTKADSTIKSYNLHTGRLNEMVGTASILHQNYVDLTSGGFDLTVDKGVSYLTIVIDLKEFLQGPEVYEFENFGDGIMGDQAAQEVIKQNAVTIIKEVNVTQNN